MEINGWRGRKAWRYLLKDLRRTLLEVLQGRWR
jgi:hypothetical protein